MFFTKISGINFSSFVFNASGVNNEILKQLQKIADSKSGAVVFKSCSVEPRKGNQPPKYIVKSDLIPGCTFNSMGLPNKGLQENLSFVKELKNYTDKPLIMSIVGINNPLAENLEMVKAFQEQAIIDMIEVNLSCVNIEGKGVLGYDFESVAIMVKELTKVKGKAKIGFKLPPYTDVNQFDRIAKILLSSTTSFVSSVNTLPGLIIDPDKGSTVIKPKQGQGGLGGDYIRPIALYNVRQLYERLANKIDIIGIGGVKSGKHAFEFLLAGASGVQVGSAFAHEGLEIFDKINSELQKILEAKKYTTIAEAKGQLKFL